MGRILGLLQRAVKRHGDAGEHGLQAAGGGGNLLRRALGFAPLGGRLHLGGGGGKGDGADRAGNTLDSPLFRSKPPPSGGKGF
ncbi:MAG: hypothetical protein WCO00_18670, partial [Rhodospirillaceae bacterium]